MDTINLFKDILCNFIVNSKSDRFILNQINCHFRQSTQSLLKPGK